jgi:pyruvate formate lyase activating enzyme
MYPEPLGEILPLIDWVGLDIKAPLDNRYDLITGYPDSASAVLASLALIMKSGISYQLRTTVHPLLLSLEDLEDLHGQLQSFGAVPTIIQKFRTQGCLDAELMASVP